MNLSLRLYIFDNDDTIKRIPLTRFEKLEHGELTFPQYASSSVRMAEVVLGLVDREPQQIIRVVGSMLHFDKTGSIQESDKENKRLTHISMGYFLGDVLTSEEKPTDKKVIQAERLFTEKALNDKFNWDMKPSDINRLVDTIWTPKIKKKQPRRGLRLVKS
ncbi:MAG: hypothetical protein KKD44_17755 [Proteobacteria bacterium]|nr:hypothetical protein [Pseudomonadota bacterium]